MTPFPKQYLNLSEYICTEALHCENDIQKLQNIVGKTYEGIAQNVPKIIQKMEDDNAKTYTLLEYFISADKSYSQSLALSPLTPPLIQFCHSKFLCGSRQMICTTVIKINRPADISGF